MAHEASDIYSLPFTERKFADLYSLSGCSEHYNEFAKML